MNVFIHDNRAVISIDTSGGSLHRRGYRIESVEAPMQETVAAALIELSGWDGERRLYDPMCGSGTLVCEALMRYCRVPAAWLRAREVAFGFERLPGFDRGVWQAVRREANASIRPLPDDLIGASDASGRAVRAAAVNAGTLPGGDRIRFQKKKFQDLPPVENTTLVSNPPYGLRIEKGSAGDLIREFGDFLKQRCRGSQAYLYLGNRELVKKVGLRTSWKKPLRSGGLDGRLVKYDLY